MQLIPVRHKVSSELYVDRVRPLPVIPGHKHILPDRCMSPRCHKAVPVPETAFTPLVEALPQILEGSFLERSRQIEKPYL
ncbi:hypothetical protein TNCV_3842161 [Trichonephila clavipes]|nr:hypothetical protein TNCV_3842161 [Trichonephila clavipes]